MRIWTQISNFNKIDCEQENETQLEQKLRKNMPQHHNLKKNLQIRNSKLNCFNAVFFLTIMMICD